MQNGCTKHTSGAPLRRKRIMRLVPRATSKRVESRWQLKAVLFGLALLSTLGLVTLTTERGNAHRRLNEAEDRQQIEVWVLAQIQQRMSDIQDDKSSFVSGQVRELHHQFRNKNRVKTTTLKEFLNGGSSNEAYPIREEWFCTVIKKEIRKWIHKMFSEHSRQWNITLPVDEGIITEMVDVVFGSFHYHYRRHENMEQRRKHLQSYLDITDKKGNKKTEIGFFLNLQGKITKHHYQKKPENAKATPNVTHRTPPKNFLKVPHPKPNSRTRSKKKPNAPAPIMCDKCKGKGKSAFWRIRCKTCGGAGVIANNI